MSSDLSELYQEVILDHYRNPRCAGDVAEPTHSATALNPLCGDEITVTLRVVGEKVEEIKHRSLGCAICVASASMMAESISGQDVSEALSGSERFCCAARGEGEVMEGKLAAFSGVSQFPMRVKCATLAWHTLEDALKK